MQPYTDKQLESFFVLVRDFKILHSNCESPDWSAWLDMRDALTEASALAYIVTKDKEHLFQAVLLRELGTSRTDWDLAKTKLDLLRKSEKVQMTNQWQGPWAMVLQLIFKTNWEAQDKIQAEFFY